MGSSAFDAGFFEVAAADGLDDEVGDVYGTEFCKEGLAVGLDGVVGDEHGGGDFARGLALSYLVEDFELARGGMEGAVARESKCVVDGLAVIVVAFEYLVNSAEDFRAVIGFVYNGVDVAGEELAEGPDFVVDGAYDDMGHGITGTDEFYEHEAVKVGELEVEDIEIEIHTRVDAIHQVGGSIEFFDVICAVVDQNGINSLEYEIMVIDYGNFHF